MPTEQQHPIMERFSRIAAECLPGHLQMKVTQIEGREVHAEMPVTQAHMAPNGFLHAASIITLADSASGYGCYANLPEGANAFTTIELKSNFLGTARDGVIECVAKAVHLGKATQVWDAEVKHRESGKTIALFRCTQMILYPKAGE